MKLKGKRNHKESWEKQTIYNLDNGSKVTVEWNQHYGQLVSRIDDKEGYWHASNGHDTIPERFSWAREWIKPIAPGHWQTIMVPQIDEY